MQQIGAVTRSVGLPADVAQMMTGDDAPELRRKRWAAVGSSASRLIFCTPHILRNDLAAGLVDPRRIVCAVFDECHHATTHRTTYAQVAAAARPGAALRRAAAR